MALQRPITSQVASIRNRCSTLTSSLRLTTSTIFSIQPGHCRTFSAAAIPHEPLTLDKISSLRANQSRLWDSIHHTAQWGAANRYGSDDTETGLRRLALSATDKFARDWFVAETKALGCEVMVDQIGNTFAVKRGRRSRQDGTNRLPATFAGSHLDSQPSGGRYDGVLGVCAGLEMLKVLDEEGIETEGDVGVVNWTNEEGARWGVSMMGSGVWAGARGKEEVWGLRDQMEGHEGRGRSVKEELETIGYLGEYEVGGERRLPMAAHFEVHIEQARRLETASQRVAMVKGVQGYVWLELVVRGKEMHAGTSAWEDRADPLVASSSIIATIPKLAQTYGGLGTVGCIEAKPGSINTIPGEVRFTVDLRHERDQNVEKMVADLVRYAEELTSSNTGLSFDMKELFKSNAINFHHTAMRCIETSAQDITKRQEIPKLVSGAGHDSVHANRHCPTAMIFVPCKDGLSHHPKEYASPEACADGASVLLQSVLRFDGQRFREKS